MLHGLAGEDAFSVVVLEHFAEEVEGVLGTEGLVVRLDELGPRLGGDPG
jgi:hypothetical protein